MFIPVTRWLQVGWRLLLTTALFDVAERWDAAAANSGEHTSTSHQLLSPTDAVDRRAVDGSGGEEEDRGERVPKCGGRGQEGLTVGDHLGYRSRICRGRWTELRRLRRKLSPVEQPRRRRRLCLVVDNSDTFRDLPHVKTTRLAQLSVNRSVTNSILHSADVGFIVFDAILDYRLDVLDYFQFI